MSDKHLLVEQWKIKPAWLAMSIEQRQAYIQATVQSMDTLSPLGMRPLGWGFTAPVAHASKFDFWSVWELDGQRAVDAFLAGLDAAGWYNYFEQENTTGVALAPQQVLEKMVLTGMEAA